MKAIVKKVKRLGTKKEFDYVVFVTGPNPGDWYEWCRVCYESMAKSIANQLNIDGKEVIHSKEIPLGKTIRLNR